MLFRRTGSCQIPLLRQRRPPSLSPQPRHFTQNTQLLLLARHTPRPQLPYLSQPSRLRRPSPFDQQVLRLLSTETRRYVKDQFWLATRWSAILWAFAVLSGITYFGFTIEIDERKNPTPAEWSFWTRNHIRAARAQKEDRGGAGHVDWARTGSEYLNTLQRLEQGPDAKDLVEQEGGEGIAIPELGKAGFDITRKSWEWRAGYFEVLIACAEAAEHLDEMVLDTTKGYVYPKETVIGPSNPDPRPTAAYMGPAPLEENTTRAFDPPESFYMRVLTGRGFTTKQRLDAAWRYAHWLEYQGLNSAAEEMYKWAVDISKSVLPSPDTVLDPQTFVIKVSELSRTSGATPNLLHATTALAVHRARTGDVASALPILLSTLRARRAAPTSPLPSDRSEVGAAGSSAVVRSEESSLDATVSFISRIFQVPKFPPPPPSGDELFVQSSQGPTCDDSELMLYIGEIVFASSPDSAEGVGWTRQAVKLAEARLDGAAEQGPSSNDIYEQQKCKSCLRAGVTNWDAMLQRLTKETLSRSAREGGHDGGPLEWRGWFGRGDGRKGKTLDEAHGGMLQAEVEEVDKLKKRIARDVVSEDMYKHRGTGGGVWLG